MKTKVGEKFIKETTHRTQQYKTNNGHLGQCEFCHTEEPDNFSNLFCIFVSNAEHQDTEEL